MFGSELRLLDYFSLFEKVYIRLFGTPDLPVRIRALYFKKFLSSHKNFRPLRILDIGSAEGCFSLYLARTYPDAHIDSCEADGIKRDRLLRIKEGLGIRNIEIREDFNSFTEYSGYDLILVIAVLEHVRRDEELLSHAYNLLKKGGILYIDVPRIDDETLAYDLTEMEKSWGHVRKGYTERGLREKLNRAGFEIIEIENAYGEEFLRLQVLFHEIFHLEDSSPLPLKKRVKLVNKIFWAISFPFFLIYISLISQKKQSAKGYGLVIQATRKR